METQQINPGGGLPPQETVTGQHAVPQLRRSREDRVVAGVCGGLARYLGVDPVLVRIAWVALTFAWGAGLLIYLIAWMVVPEEREGEVVVATTHRDGTTARLVIGGTLILVGALFLINRFAPWFDWGLAWSALLIALGALVIMRGVSR